MRLLEGIPDTGLSGGSGQRTPKWLRHHGLDHASRLQAEVLTALVPP
jgi:hypothetical protein